MTAALPTADSTLQRFELVLEQLHARRRQLSRQIDQQHAWLTKLLKKHGKTLETIRQDAPRAAAATALAGALMVIPGTKQPTEADTPHAPPAAAAQAAPTPPPVNVPDELHNLLPNPTSDLSSSAEQQLADMFSSAYHIQATPELEGHRLNVVLSIMGGEQHLRRYPGDVATDHANSHDERPALAGMAPGNGAYGLWANSKDQLSPQAIEQEKYYIAVQTFLAPGFRDNTKDVYNWFRYRKMLVVNAKTGQAVVADVGDSGPATWTGKSSGGSPEVMDVLGLGEGPRKGPVLLYFINDPDNKVPLGPISPVAPQPPPPQGAK